MADEQEYPHEQPRPENVVNHPARAYQDIPVVDILRGAYRAELHDIVVVGVKDTGVEFLSTSMADTSLAIYRLQRAIHTLNMIMDQLQDEISPDGPGRAGVQDA